MFQDTHTANRHTKSIKTREKKLKLNQKRVLKN